ncbi:CLUMA_CG013757, isoform A [Clunio marinus]|uniref:CLUMA_CG013757, isoform A n=1 Tax=Clunio marinus TaxID=568069 RepID=A0A1J1IJY0_9DIPT|nr:CLUMA_CG013757, isoform A [Clunio marinus]
MSECDQDLDSVMLCKKIIHRMRMSCVSETERNWISNVIQLSSHYVVSCCENPLRVFVLT